MKARTRAVHAGAVKPEPGKPVPAAPPIEQASASLFHSLDDLEAAYEADEPLYRRYGGPNQAQLEAALVMLELPDGARSLDYRALVTASGMAAIHLSCVVASRGRPVVAPGDVYGGTLRLLKHDLPRAGITTRVVDGNDDAQLDAALDGAGLLLVETISNPAMRVYDIHDLCRRAHARDVAVIVDNTFASPILCRPLSAGADMVMHSSTKYLSGHGDAMGGGLVYRREFDQEMRRVAISYGPSPGPFDSWLALRGLRTLALRVESASRNAEVVAAWLSQHPAVARVYYPGLSGHPSHAVAARVLEGGFGGMLAFDLKGGGEAASRACRRMNLITIMPSLADVATTVSHPFSTSHRGLTEDELALAGVTPGMLRLSAGIEDPDDIVADLEQALAGA